MLGRPGLKRLDAVILLALVSLCAAYAESPDSRKHVLLIHQNDGTFPASVAFERTLVEGLREKLGSNLDLYREQLDSDRFPERTADKIAELRSKYANRGIDVVIFSGNVPTMIIPKVPVIQVDNAPYNQTLQDVYGDDAVHVSFNIDPLKTVAVAQRLQPEARKIILISGCSTADRVYLDEFRRRLTASSTLEIETIDNATISDLSAILSKLTRNVIVLPISYSMDPHGLSYTPGDVMAHLASVSAVPLYAVSDTYIGTGMVGGYVVRWEKAGQLAADAALRILAGEPRADVISKSSGSGAYIFDWRQLQRWGFSQRDLPPESIIEYKVLTVWEQYQWRIVTIAALIILQSLLIIALLVHRHQRNKAEKSLREMTGRLLQSQDDERRRIARDLHDGTGQHLAGIALSVGEVLAEFPGGYDHLRQLLQKSHAASRQALNEVRAVSYALHPPILDGLGLLPALQWYLDGLQKRTNFTIDLDVSQASKRTPPEIERTLFRIVQESVTNALYHSGGTAMSVKLYDCSKGITLEVEDNGHGINTQVFGETECPTSIGVGIAGMRERVRQFDGTFMINSSSDGTRVLVVLPNQ